MRATPGEAPADPGLNHLDEDRAHSMADEGGASAATVEGAAAPGGASAKDPPSSSPSPARAAALRAGRE